MRIWNRQRSNEWQYVSVSVCMGSRICICIWICAFFVNRLRMVYLVGCRLFLLQLVCGICTDFCTVLRCVFIIFVFCFFFWFSDTIDGGKPLFMAVMECNRATGTIQNAAHILPLPDELWLNCDVSVGGWGGWPTNHTTCLTVLQIAVPLLCTDRGIPFISVSKVSCLSKDKYSKIHLHRR